MVIWSLTASLFNSCTPDLSWSYLKCSKADRAAPPNLSGAQGMGQAILCQKYGDTKLTVSGKVFEICISDLVL